MTARPAAAATFFNLSESSRRFDLQLPSPGPGHDSDPGRYVSGSPGPSGRTARTAGQARSHLQPFFILDGLGDHRDCI